MHRAMWVAALLAVGCSGGPGSEEDRGKAEQVDPVTVVEVVAASSGAVADELTSSAVVEAEAQADLVPEASGVVVQILKDEGDAVKKGDVLAILDNVALGTGAERASAEVARLEAQVNQARELSSRGAVSSREVEDLEYQLRAARLSSREATRSYGQTRITAPFDGVVSMRDVHVGELAGGARAAFQVVDPRRLRVVTTLPERDLGRVRVGQPARLISAYDAEVWTTGHVERVSPVVDAGSGTFRVTVGLDGDVSALRPGQFVSVRIEVDRHDPVTVVPKQAVVWEDGTPVVYRVVPAPPPEADAAEPEAEGGWFASLFGGDEPEAEPEADADGERLVAKRTRVELGLVDEQLAEIRGGLSQGDEVITIGQSHLRDGARVRPGGPAAAEGAAVSAEASGEKG